MEDDVGIQYSSSSSSMTLRHNGAQQQQPQQIVELGAWLSLCFGMTLAAFLFFIVFMLLFVSALHIPLPNEICDRRKVQILEFMLRLGNEYLGDFVEIVAGVRVRNRLTRFLTGLPYYFQSKPPKWCNVRDEIIAGVRCRVYLPLGDRRRSNAAILYIHGGGWCIMRPKFYDGPLLSLITRIGTPIISIDYRLSPEAQYPSAIIECERVLREIHDRKYADYGIDPTKLGLMGDSAGGNLCAVLSQRALRQKIDLVKCQVLIYPVINFLDLLSPSYRYFYQSYKGTALLNPKCLARWCLLYAGIEATPENIKATLKNQHVPKEIKEDKEIISLIDHSHLPQSMTLKNEELKEKIKKFSSYTAPIKKDLAEKMHKLLKDPDFCPLIGTNLNGLAPAMIVTAGIDILRDEGFFYAKRLRSFGVPVQWNHYDSAFHGIIHMPGSKQRKQILDDIAQYLTTNLL